MNNHPAPRFEILYKPLHYLNATARRNEYVTPNPQPYSARFIGGNGEEVWRTSETYVHSFGAQNAVDLLRTGNHATIPVLRREVAP